MPIKIYSGFDKALEDIGYDGKAQFADFRIKSDRKREAGERGVKAFFDTEFAPWMEREFRIMEARGGEYAEYVQTVSEILLHLIENAEYASKRWQTFTAELYAGRRGCLAGTRQEAKFFDADQIELLTDKAFFKRGRGKPAPLLSMKEEHDTKNRPEGRGTALFAEQDGLLILNQKKPALIRAIYVAKYYPR